MNIIAAIVRGVVFGVLVVPVAFMAFGVRGERRF